MSGCLEALCNVVVGERKGRDCEWMVGSVKEGERKGEGGQEDSPSSHCFFTMYCPHTTAMSMSRALPWSTSTHPPLASRNSCRAKSSLKQKLWLKV